MITLTPRLAAAASFVRPDSLLLDVGTDHAYLPIHLCEQGRRSPSVASDINEGPVERATAHVAMSGLSDRITVVRTDGLTGLDRLADDTRPLDVVICGMGGELIASILSAAPWIKRSGTRLILQPMTHSEKLREYLLSSGFAPVAERLCAEPHPKGGERIYQIICAEYTPHADTPAYSPAELQTGRLYPPEDADLHRQLIEKTLHAATLCADARRLAGLDTSAEDATVASLRAQLPNIGGHS
jgi:tRNA (adenine22-N1)-methyltransferase